jgi:hypothetical protein
MAEARVERRLAAILAADVAGFSHLTCRDVRYLSCSLLLSQRSKNCSRSYAPAAFDCRDARCVTLRGWRRSHAFAD